MLAYSTRRPISIGTYPDPHAGYDVPQIVRIENYEHPIRVEGCAGRAYGLIEYDGDLTESDLWRWDLESPELNRRYHSEAERIALLWLSDQEWCDIEREQAATCHRESWDPARFDEAVDATLARLA